MKIKGLITMGKNYILEHKLGCITVTSLVGLATTVVTTVLATRNTLYDIADAQYAYEEENGEGSVLPPKEKAKIIAKNGAGAAVSTGLTATSIIFGYKEASKEIQNGIMAINALSEMREVERLYRRKVAERLGEKEERKLRDEVALNRAEESAKKYAMEDYIYNTGNGNTVFRDAFGGFMYRSSWDAVNKAYDRWFGTVRSGQEEFVNFNELYYHLGLPVRTQAGESMGITSFHQLSIESDLHYTYDDKQVDPDHPVATIYIDDEYITVEKEMY